MKKMMVLAVGGALFSILPLAADTEYANGYTWTYRINGDTAEIYKGSWSAAISPNPTGVVTIPATLGGKPVTSIGYCAFYSRKNLTGIIIPDSVTSIGQYAFGYCRGLTSITIPDSVTSIEGYSFINCSGVRNVTVNQTVCKWNMSTLFSAAYQAITNIVISDNVTRIPSGFFDGCKELKSIVVAPGNSFYKSEDGLVLNNSGTILVAAPKAIALTNLAIPDSVTNIEYRALSGCNNVMAFMVSSGNPSYKSVSGLLLSKDGDTLVAVPGCLSDVTIPNSVTRIGYYAFMDCSGLANVTIPNSVTNIGVDAFSGCSSLSNVAIPGSIVNIHPTAFSDCRSLTAFAVSSGNPSYKSVSGLLLAKDEKTLVTVPCGLTSVTIPVNVTIIGEDAFYSCNGLTNVTLPRGLTKIGRQAFCNCENLASLEVPDSVTSIGQFAFSGCRSLRSITFGSGVESIGSYAFMNCLNLTRMIFRGNAPPRADSYSFAVYGCTAYVKEDSTGWGVEIPGTWNGLAIQYLTPEVEIAVANETGAGTVELDGELPDEVEVTAGVTVVVKGVDMDAAALAAKVTPLPHEEGQSANLFKVATSVAAGSVSLSVVLDEDVVDPGETAGEIVGGENMAAFRAAADGESVSVSLPSAKSGLYYGIAAANDLALLDAAAARAPLVRADADGATVSVARPAGNVAFFKVIVSDRGR